MDEYITPNYETIGVLEKQKKSETQKTADEMFRDLGYVYKENGIGKMFPIVYFDEKSEVKVVINANSVREILYCGGKWEDIFLGHRELCAAYRLLEEMNLIPY